MSDSPPDPFAFEPVPSASNRHDGWTPERQRDFILVLAKIGVVAFAARAVGMSRKSAYALLKRAGPESSFAEAFADARTAGRTTAWFTAVGRAIEGEEVPYFYRGIQRGTRRVYDNRILIAASAPSSGRRAATAGSGRPNDGDGPPFTAIATRRTGTFVTFAPFADRSTNMPPSSLFARLSRRRR